jgi:hypothetical protein
MVEQITIGVSCSTRSIKREAANDSGTSRAVNQLMKSIVSPPRTAEVPALALLLGGTAAAWYMHEGVADFSFTIFLVAIPLAVVWLIPNLKAGRRK